MDLKTQIAGVPLFASLPDAAIARLDEAAALKTYARGAAVFSDGDAADGFHVVLSGQVKLFKLSPAGKEQILHIFGPGHPIGEAAVFEGRPFPASAAALEASEIMCLPRRAVFALVEENPSLAFALLAVFSRRLRDFVSLVEDLALKEVPNRLAAYLEILDKQQPDSDVVTIEVPKSQLANMLGATPETLSRVLARLSNDGVLELLNNRRVRIRDRDTLGHLSSGRITMARRNSA